MARRTGILNTMLLSLDLVDCIMTIAIAIVAVIMYQAVTTPLWPPKR